MVTGELWLVAGEETGDDSPLTAEPEVTWGGGLLTAGEAEIDCSYETEDFRIKQSPPDKIQMVHEKGKNNFSVSALACTQ